MNDGWDTNMCFDDTVYWWEFQQLTACFLISSCNKIHSDISTIKFYFFDLFVFCEFCIHQHYTNGFDNMKDHQSIHSVLLSLNFNRYSWSCDNFFKRNLIIKVRTQFSHSLDAIIKLKVQIIMCFILSEYSSDIRQFSSCTMITCFLDKLWSFIKSENLILEALDDVIF